MLPHRITILVSVLASAFAIVSAQQDCTADMTTEEFRTYTERFSECVKGDITIPQSSVPIDFLWFDIDGNVVPDDVDYDEISTFCSEVARCKSAVTSCEASLASFITESGMALCANGEAITKDIMDAVNILKSETCIESDEESLDGVSNQGCFLGPEAGFSSDGLSYLNAISRNNKKRSAEQRCIARYYVSQGVCSAAAARAQNLVTGASERLESIGTTYQAYTDYATPSFSNAQTTFSLRGMSHLYKDSSRVETCESLDGSRTLLWNTYIKVDGTMSRLIPTTNFNLLTQLTIDFSNDAGHVIDTYTTSIRDDALATQTLQRQAGGSSLIQIEKINNNLIVLTHLKNVQMKVAVARVSQGLSVHLSMPTDLLNRESVGVLVDGCAAYGGIAKSDLTTGLSSECKQNCSSLQTYTNECAYDCTNSLKQHVEVYQSIDLQEDNTVWDFSEVSSAHLISSSTAFVVTAAAVLLLNL